MIPITRCSSIQGVWGQRGEKGSFQLASVLEECNSCLQLSFMFSFLYFCSLLNRTCVEKGPYSQNYGFTSSRTWIWELDHKEGWPLKYWCFRTVVLEMILESPFTCKEIKSLHSKGNQSWIFIGRTDAEAEAPILWPPDGKNWLIGKHPDAGKDWRQEEKGMTEDEMAGWHHRLDGYEFEQTSGHSGGQRSLKGYSPWHHKESNMTDCFHFPEFLCSSGPYACISLDTGEILLKKVKVLVTQLCPTLCDPMDCNLPGSSVHGILQARILEWIAICSSRGSSWLRDWTQCPALQADSLPSEPPGKPCIQLFFTCHCDHFPYCYIVATTIIFQAV